MTIGQEQLHVLEQIGKRQHQVYQDACDFGVEATPETTAEIRKACLELAQDYNSTKKTETYGTGATREWTVIIPIERDDYDPSCYDCLEVKVTKVETVSKRYCDYFTISIKRVSKPTSYKFFKPESKAA